MVVFVGLVQLRLTPSKLAVAVRPLGALGVVAPMVSPDMTIAFGIDIP
jgi:hypothetical protein